MPGGVIQLDPVVMGDDREDERRRAAARAEAQHILASAGADEALSGVAVPSPPDGIRNGPSAPPLRPAPTTPELDRMEAEAREVGDRYRASLHTDAPSGGAHPPPASPASAATSADEPRTMRLEPVDPAVGYTAPPPPATLRAPHPDAEAYGAATDADPVLPGHRRPSGADPNAEIWGEATDADPVLPGQPGPGARASQSLGDPAFRAPPRPRQAGAEFVDPSGPEFVDPTAGGPARPSAQLADPSPRAQLERILRARQAQRAAPSPAPAEPEPDFTGADWNDALRRPLHAIGNALLAASGRSPTPFRSERAQIEARMAREAGQQSEQAESAADRALAERRMALQERQAATQAELGRERNQISRDMQAGRLDVSRDRADIARRAAELRAQGLGESEAYARARREALEFELSTRQAMRDPASPASQSARASLMAELDTLRDEVGFDPPPQVRAMLERASGEQIRRYRETLMESGVLRPRTHRRGGAGGGGGLSPETRAALNTPPMGWTGSEDQWRALSLGARRDAIEELGTRAPGRGASGAGGEVGTEILPGIRSPIHMPASEARGLRDGIAEAGASAANIRGLASVHERYGGLGARISREAQAEIVPRLTIARAMVASMGGTGVINPTEVPNINAALPDPGDLTSMTFGTFNSRMRTWQDLLESKVRAKLASRGVDDAGINRAIQIIRTGSFSSGGDSGGSSQQPRVDTARVRHPDGRTGTVPRANLQRALDAGFVEVR